MASNLPIEQILVFGNMRYEVFYKTQEWRRARLEALMFHGNRCQLCGNGPQNGVALHVDHIKPRFMHPELCLSLHNLQVLCEDCHTAKGVHYFDDFRARMTQLRPDELRNIFRVRRKHLIFEHRHPKNPQEMAYLQEDVIAQNKNQRKRWRGIVHYAMVTKMRYPEVASLTVDQFLEHPFSRNNKFRRFLHSKTGDDFIFDIAGCPLPPSLHDLLADEERAA